jgi:sporulation protein YlmC with PRC-barrel domain
MVIRSSELTGRKVRMEDGQVLGRVHEIHAEAGRVKSLTVGAGGWLQRLAASRHGKRIGWEQVVRMDADGIVVRKATRAPGGR